MRVSPRFAATYPSTRVGRVQVALGGLGVLGVAFAVLGSFFWCEEYPMAIVASLALTSAAAAIAAALPISGAVARIAAALAAGSVIGALALGLTFLALGQAGCGEGG